MVPPRHALATASRISEASKLPDTTARREGAEDPEGLPTRRKPYYVDLNAIPAGLSCEMGSLLADSAGSSPMLSVLFQVLDGGTIGPPPPQNQDRTWKRPILVILGSVDLAPSFPKLAEILNMKLVSPMIGAASTLKLTFAALSRGLTALSTLSWPSGSRFFPNCFST